MKYVVHCPKCRWLSTRPERCDLTGCGKDLTDVDRGEWLPEDALHDRRDALLVDDVAPDDDPRLEDLRTRQSQSADATAVADGGSLGAVVMTTRDDVDLVDEAEQDDVDDSLDEEARCPECHNELEWRTVLGESGWYCTECSEPRRDAAPPPEEGSA